MKVIASLEYTQLLPLPVPQTWTKCVICHEDKNEELVCPAESTSQYNVEAGYAS